MRNIARGNKDETETVRDSDRDSGSDSDYIKIHENRHQKINWSIIRESAGLHTTTSTLKVGEQDR